MKPVYHYLGFKTFDLTQGQVHKLPEPDGSFRVVAVFPKEWTALEPAVRVTSVHGETVEYKPYTVLAWDEILLATIPAPASKGEGE